MCTVDTSLPIHNYFYQIIISFLAEYVINNCHSFSEEIQFMSIQIY